MQVTPTSTRIVLCHPAVPTQADKSGVPTEAILPIHEPNFVLHLLTQRSEPPTLKVT